MAAMLQGRDAARLWRAQRRKAAPRRERLDA
jgi:hypothetical protein